MFADLREMPPAAIKSCPLVSPQEQTLDLLQRLEADVAEINLTEMRQIEKLHPDWFSQYEETPLETCDSAQLQALLSTAPSSYAKGIVIGALKIRLEIASATGRMF